MDINAYRSLLKYSNPFSILVVTNGNDLIEVNCPFKVEVIRNIKNMMIGETKEVAQVKLATNNALVYIIDSQPYFYYYFNIII